MVEVWDATDIAAPVFTGRMALPNGTNESYALRVDPTGHRVYVAADDGKLYIVNSQMIGPPASVYTVF